MLNEKSEFYPDLLHLATIGLISLFNVDAVHAVMEQYDSFHPEFKHAIESILKLRSLSIALNPGLTISILAMSATFPLRE